MDRSTYLEDLGIPHKFLHRVFTVVAISTKNLSHTCMKQHQTQASTPQNHQVHVPCTYGCIQQHGAASSSGPTCVPVWLHAHLYSIRCSLVGHVSCQGFCDGGVVGVSAALVNLPGASVAHQTSRLNPNGHIGNLEGHSLVLVWGLAMQEGQQ